MMRGMTISKSPRKVVQGQLPVKGNPPYRCNLGIYEQPCCRHNHSAHIAFGSRFIPGTAYGVLF